MERRVFEAALRAAAKITFGTSLASTFGGTLLGCGGVVTIDPSDETDESTPALGGYGPADLPSQGGYAPSDGGSGEGGSVEVPVCAQPAEPPGGWGVYDQATFDCCVERIDSLEPDAMPETFDENVSACCSQLLDENYSAIWQNQPLVHDAPQQVIDACCLYAHGNVGCSPWGPPVPIAMDPGDYVPWVMDELGEHPVPLRRVA
jgi:hypothetical protein